jgi:hypothetical protein
VQPAAATAARLLLKMLRAWQKLRLLRCHLARYVLQQQAQRQQAKPETGCSSKLLPTALHHLQQQPHCKLGHSMPLLQTS